MGFLEDVLEARAYAHAKAMTDAAETAEARQRLPRTPLFLLVTEIEFEIVNEDREAHRSDGSADDD